MADLLIIVLCSAILDLTPLMNRVFYVYIVSGWLITTFSLKFYEVYRFTPLIKIMYLLIRQLIVFTMLIFAFYGFFDSEKSDLTAITNYAIVSGLLITLVKLAVHTLLKKYRLIVGRNYRKVVIVGQNPKTVRLQDFFQKNPAYGYELQAVFDLKDKSNSISHIQNYVMENNVDELYCSVSELKNRDINALVHFSDNNLKTVKFLPDNKDIYSRQLNYQYYGITPILSLRELPIDNAFSKFLKRGLDVSIAILVILGILSWLTPLVAIFIKRESKGPVFYKQSRNGLSGKPFECYKYRSMIAHDDRDAQQVVKNDKRVTRTGLFLRRTSIDELPQFINVLLGDMSVVGPRPHPLTQTRNFAKRIDKFMVRHLVKPGITGLAQISGYRGEVETENDIKNRVRFDIFYLENWSLLMDLRIIAKTVVQIFKGDSKAY